MDNMFETRRFFKRQAIKFISNGLRINKKTLFESIEYEVLFDNIDNKKSISTEVNIGQLVIAFFFLITGSLYLSGDYFKIATILYLIAVSIIIYAFSTKKRVITINCYGDKNIELHFTKSNENEVRKFADEIIKASNDFLLNKYSKIDKDLPIENQLNNLIFLKNREIIDEDRFQELKNQLLGKEGKSIGFGK
jgi:hypothetical protein